MSDAFSKITSILLCVFMMFIIPVFYMKEESERLKQTYILAEVTSFVDGVRNTGILAKDDYDMLEKELFDIGGGYSIRLEHSEHIHDEEGSGLEYFEVRYYNEQIAECFESGNDYYLKKNDYLKVVVYDAADKLVVWYGGSIRYEAY